MKKWNWKALVCVGATALLCLSGCHKQTSQKNEKFSHTDFVMDTVLNITLYAQKDDSPEIKEELETLEKDALSWRVEDSLASEINRKCAEGQKVEMDAAFANWTKHSIELAQKSEGAFDPTIGNLTRLWNIEGENPTVPEENEINACLKTIGYEHINIEEALISMEEGTTLDLGAVGKGIGCDVVETLLSEKQGVQGAVVAIGGSIVVFGEKPDGSDWNVAIRDPEQEDGVPMGVISLQGTHHISTSGDYEKCFEKDGKTYHHILDPATGYPSESGLRSVTIVCENGLLADGLSTACFVLGVEKGMQLAEQYEAEAIFITDDHEVLMTEEMEDQFRILEKKYKVTTLPSVSE